MKHFLFRVAETYFRYHADEINRFTFVFPNRRAGIFFQQYLSQVAGKSFFSPEIITIEQWFEAASDLAQADKLFQLFKLYELFHDESKSDEPFDSFAYWGEIILNDFNEVDKYRVDASQLFSNISDLKNIDEEFDYLTENQLNAIRSFWQNFNPHSDKKNQQEFIATWKVLYPLYNRFRNELADLNLAYEGMLMRNVADKLHQKTVIKAFENKYFVFVGFNALNPCEKSCMKALKELNQADFYWDYDAEALRDPENPASLFYRENTLTFPSKYTLETEYQSLTDKTINLIKVPSGVGQAKEVYKILRYLYPEQSTEKSFLQTAVVLPDEQLLMPVLYSIPEHIRNINVTMGYPMSQTSVAGLIDHVFELHRKKRFKGKKQVFYHKNVTNILNHQLLAEIDGGLCRQLNNQITSGNKIYIDEELLGKSLLLKNLFRADISVQSLLPYLKDLLFTLYKVWKSTHSDSEGSFEPGFLYQYYTTINRIQQLTELPTAPEIHNIDTLIRLIREMTSVVTIPFVGEPLDGLQIMGVLETRGLDFQNILLCSFNEGVYPKKSFANSFIPYQLRKGFELPTFEQLDAVSSYNFYRLIHHARVVYLLTDTRNDGTSTGEVSRFYYQLKYYYKIDINISSPGADLRFQSTEPLSITKNERIMNLLHQYTDTGERAKALSASAINSYIKCPMQFCLSQLEDIDKPDEISETIENDVFGNILHAVMAELYLPYTGKLITQNILKELLENEFLLDRLLTNAFGKYFYKVPSDTTIQLEGSNLLIARVLKKYIKGILLRDADYCPFTFIAGELLVCSQLPTRYGTINIKGFIDRIDEKEGSIRILDYKTGSGELIFKSWEAVFEHDITPLGRPKHVLQTFLYGYLYKSKSEHKVITPGIIYTRKVFNEHFSTQLTYKIDQNNTNTIENYYDYEEEFLFRLTSCVEEIFNPEVPFFQTSQKENCTYCDFKSICKR